jgi:hypothetical protein
MTVFVEGRHPGEAIMSEGNGNISRDNVTIPESTTVEANTLLGRLAVVDGAAVAAHADTDNEGDGELVLSEPAISSSARNGEYLVECIVPGVNAIFRVRSPSGKFVGDVAMGAEFDGPVKFSITAGENDFALSDFFTIRVRAASVHAPFDPQATNGAEEPVAYSIYPVKTGPGETKQTAVISRKAVLNGNCIAWPVGITEKQKRRACKALAERVLIVR